MFAFSRRPQCILLLSLMLSDVVSLVSAALCHTEPAHGVKRMTHRYGIRGATMGHTRRLLLVGSRIRTRSKLLCLSTSFSRTSWLVCSSSCLAQWHGVRETRGHHLTILKTFALLHKPSYSSKGFTTFASMRSI